MFQEAAWKPCDDLIKQIEQEEEELFRICTLQELLSCKHLTNSVLPFSWPCLHLGAGLKGHQHDTGCLVGNVEAVSNSLQPLKPYVNIL